ncbi:PDGLE domain-containing protein [Qaidamihabitans albus]|uniref:PDGLE domain-containing protein n=1 Tax=Qaidamihabitans albus TaxID=2795733 RepID=UPI0018F16D3E|nr:PDGLE domain-containing protein [Qaidamihabitans albus]
MTTVRRRGVWLFTGVALICLLLAGGVSYLADSAPDGLESVLDDGCTETGGELRGSCAGQHARDHALADSPLADYAVAGNDSLTGVAGVLGVLATLAVAGGLFRLLRRRAGKPAGPDG